MKTLEELYKEVIASEEKKAAVSKSLQEGTIADFLKENGCEATVEEVAEFLKSKQEVSADELEMMSGGCGTVEKFCTSILSVGVLCGAAALYSATITGIEGVDKDDVGFCWVQA